MSLTLPPPLTAERVKLRQLRQETMLTGKLSRLAWECLQNQCEGLRRVKFCVLTADVMYVTVAAALLMGSPQVIPVLLQS